MKPTHRRSKAPSFRPALELLEDRLAPATLPTGFAETRLATGMREPTAMEFAPDGRLFVLQQTGEVRIIKNGALLSAPFMQINVDSSGERGLLGIAFDPDFATNQHIYVYYTVPGSSPRNRVSRFTANGDTVVPGSEVVIFELDGVGNTTNHNGGAIHFGPEPDPKLYIAVGDNGVGSNSQSLNNLHGKMLRINKDGSIPTDNPFYNQTTGKNRAIWALGLRNPFTFAFQPGTGRMFINDVGQNAFEEINDGMPGANYGWPSVEGNNGNPPSSPGTYHAPVHVYSHGNSSNQGYVVTGGAFYNPTTVNFPSDYVGDYFFADYASGWIRKLDLPNTSGSNFIRDILGPIDLRVASDGSLWYLARGYGTNTGEVWRVTYTDSSAPSISQHPASLTRSEGQSATFTVVASGAQPLSYQWQRDGVNIPGANSASYMLNSVTLNDNGGTFRCIVTNDQGTATSNLATLTVIADQPPTATITSPSATKTYTGGERIFFSGTGMDLEDGVLPGSQFEWKVLFHHDTHTHGGPTLTLDPDGKGGYFDAGAHGHSETNVFYRIELKVTDSKGNTHIATRDVHPKLAQFTIVTSPAGLELTLDGQPYVGGTPVSGVVGVHRIIGTPEVQVVNGVMYEFDHWSDGGEATHEIVTPEGNTTYTAVFRTSGSGAGLAATYYDNKDFTAPILQRVDPMVNFDWKENAPDTALGADKFSVRWTGQVQAQFSEAYTFNVKADDGVRLWIDGKKVIDTWSKTGSNKTLPIQMEAGRKYAITLDYFENKGPASVMLMWRSPSTPKMVVPMSQLYSTLNSVGGPWQSTTIGPAPLGGSATEDEGLFTITSSGRRIGKDADAFQFVYQVLEGDGSITARILSVQNSDAQSRGGVMLRESLAADSPFAMMGLTADRQNLFQSRLTQGALADKVKGPNTAAPLWVRLVRTGNRVTGFHSTDGVSWTQVGFVDLPLGSEVLVGLAVAAHNDAILANALFDNVNVA